MYSQEDLEAMTKAELKQRLWEDFQYDASSQLNKTDLVRTYQRGQNGENLNAVKRVRLTLHSDGTPTGGQPQFVGVNGYGYTIPRDTPVDVPEEVVEALNNAKMAYLEDTGETGGDGEKIYREREVGRFAFSVER